MGGRNIHGPCALGGYQLCCLDGGKWSADLGAAQVETLILAGQNDFCAGPADSKTRQGGCFLKCISLANGQVIAETQLTASPGWSGLAAADGHLFVATEDGKVICLSGRYGERFALFCHPRIQA